MNSYQPSPPLTRDERRYIGDCSGPESARTVPHDTGVMHGPGRSYPGAPMSDRIGVTPRPAPHFCYAGDACTVPHCAGYPV